MRLIEHIIDKMHSSGNGVIPFNEFMHLCLYASGLGYYTAGSIKFGADGDFVTAPELSSLFGYTLANHFGKLFEQGFSSSVLEIGAGTGKLCIDVIHHFFNNKAKLDTYFILEPSADLQERQRELLTQKLSSEWLAKIKWLKAMPEGFEGVVIGNEVLDAMPVNVVVKEDEWTELGVKFSKGRFEWEKVSKGSEAVKLIKEIDKDNLLPKNYCTEVNLNYKPWCQSLAESCGKVAVILIDYGYSESQYYHPQRVTGTLNCFYRHRSHPDPFVYPGLQDITAFVDFDNLANAAKKAGFEINGIQSQANFLLSNGLLDLEQPENNETEIIKHVQQVKTLTLPDEMGDKFKVLSLFKNKA